MRDYKKRRGIMEVLWDFRVVIDLFLGGIGVGLYLLAVLVLLLNKSEKIPSAKIALLLSPILVATGVLALATELGKPFRMITTFVNVNSTSVTSWGGFLQAAFILLAAISAFVVFTKKEKLGEIGWFKYLLAVGSLFAVLVGLYHGALLMSLGRSGWESGLIPVVFFVSSLLVANSIMIVLDIMNSKKANVNPSNYLSKSLFVLLLVQLFLIAVWRISIFYANADAIIAYKNLLDVFGIYWWLGALLLGLVLPLILVAYNLVKKTEHSLNTMLTVAVLVILGSYTLKHIIVYAGQLPIGL